MLYRTYKGGIRLTTQQIRFFLEAAECLNFTEAAKRLFVTQSTLSKQIALLEDELGLKLFYRSNRTVGLTPAGSLFRGEMEKVEHRLTEAIDRARHVNRGLDGTLSVGILDIIDPSLFVSPLLKLFQERYPRVELSISLCGFSKLREGLEKGLLDVGFGKGFDLFSLPDLEGMEVYQNSPSILMPSRHPLALADRLEVPQLKDEQFVVLSQDECGASVIPWWTCAGRMDFILKSPGTWIPTPTGYMRCPSGTAFPSLTWNFPFPAGPGWSPSLYIPGLTAFFRGSTCGWSGPVPAPIRRSACWQPWLDS